MKTAQASWQELGEMWKRYTTVARTSLAKFLIASAPVLEPLGGADLVEKCMEHFHWSRSCAYRWRRIAIWAASVPQWGTNLILDGLPLDIHVLDILSQIDGNQLLKFSEKFPEAFNGVTHTREEWQTWVDQFLQKPAKQNDPCQTDFFNRLGMTAEAFAEGVANGSIRLKADSALNFGIHATHAGILQLGDLSREDQTAYLQQIDEIHKQAHLIYAAHSTEKN